VRRANRAAAVWLAALVAGAAPAEEPWPRPAPRVALAGGFAIAGSDDGAAGLVGMLHGGVPLGRTWALQYEGWAFHGWASHNPSTIDITVGGLSLRFSRPQQLTRDLRALCYVDLGGGLAYFRRRIEDGPAVLVLGAPGGAILGRFGLEFPRWGPVAPLLEFGASFQYFDPGWSGILGWTVGLGW
jgi:hypothetical protein